MVILLNRLLEKADDRNNPLQSGFVRSELAKLPIGTGRWTG